MPSSNREEYRYSAELQFSRPFDWERLAPDRALANFSNAALAGADNLLRKALAALRAGDRDRAETIARRAAAMPFDERERTMPAAWSAHLLVFNAVIDALEASPADDSRWLRVLFDVTDQAAPDARCTLKHILATAVKDYRLEPAEGKQARRHIATLPDDIPIEDRDDFADSELADRVIELLDLALAYERALGRGPEPAAQ